MPTETKLDRGRPKGTSDPSKRTSSGRYKSEIAWRQSHPRLSVTLTDEDRRLIARIMRRTGISTMVDAIRWALRDSTSPKRST